MDFNPLIGEFGEGDEEMKVDASILEGFQENQIPGKEAIARLIGSVFPTCIAMTYITGTVIVELPRSEEAVFQETLQDMPLIIAGAPFNLQYHNVPLANVGRLRRAKKPKPQLAEEDCAADETDYVTRDGRFYPGAILSSVGEKGIPSPPYQQACSSIKGMKSG
ncbi:hypothetical protein B0T26DRAFT_752761 [Lasiosphaeria miniovina]|uniref:Uncharacterized protein n=1 Tax=Lasiosphaeria miniovina TaxID=1954250 RepID=A0AA40DQN2_9PEZI|nr:uncharacterized protein B0T26DRAFT_752761 [Lasiosphaeria miniovina]KAK0712534.1 hypothetical protein B0T26DRAFT_752761 [Lasiosphaeria miniovina]